MDSKFKKFGLLAASMMLAYGMDQRGIISGTNTKKPAETWKLKKCKSCAFYPCRDSRHTWRSNPLAQACEKHKQKNKRK